MTIDRHYTPPALAQVGAQLLRRHVAPASRVLEPCAGTGRVAGALREAGYVVTTGDLDPGVAVDYRWDYPEAVALGRVPHHDAVCTNPPYSLSGAFAAASLQIAPVVALLLPLQHLEEVGARPAALLRQLAEIVVCPRVEFDSPGARRARNGVSFTTAWYLWARGHSGGAVTTWVSREEYAALSGQTSLLDLTPRGGARYEGGAQLDLIGGE